MKVLVVTYPVPKDIRKIIDYKETDYIIGVDQALFDLYKQRIKINLAIGDFDSLKNEGILNQLNVIRLDKNKDVTDTYKAVEQAYKLNKGEVFLIGGLGANRVEHTYANLNLFNDFNDLVIINDYSKISLKKIGKHEFSFPEYISIFAFEDSIITLTGFKYGLNNYNLKLRDSIGISNELIDNKGYLEVIKGSVIVFETKCDQK